MSFKISPIALGVKNSADTLLRSHQWKSVRIEFSNGEESTLWGVRGISYSTEVQKSTVKGLKDATVVNTVYDKTYTGSMVVLQSEIERWYANNSDLRKYSLVDFAEFNIIITMPSNTEGLWSETTLENCRFMNDARDYSQANGEPEITLNLAIASIVAEKSQSENPDN